MINKQLKVDEYFDDPVNTTMINERCIELALGIRYMEKVGHDSLTEVGAVMPHYGYAEHRVIDLFSEDTGTDMAVWEQEFDKPYRYANGNIFLLPKVAA